MTSARDAIAADLQHARDGIAFYTNRITVLENIRRQIDQMQDTPGAAASAAPRTRAGTIKSTASRAKTAVGKIPSPSSAKLPATKAGFWLSLLSETPISNKEFLAAAIAALKIRPDPAALQKLKQRLANAINLMTNDGSMQSEGIGRARRFSIKAA